MQTFLLIALVIAIALAPLVQFLPSKRQREVAGLREYAALHGLFVEFRHVPAPGRVSEPARPEPLSDLIYYGKRIPSSRAGGVESAAWRRDGGDWRSIGRRLPAPAPLRELSIDVVAASVDQFSCGVYWRETEGEAAVEQIRQVLERWCASLVDR